jgi:hypothetical protein
MICCGWALYGYIEKFVEVVIFRPYLEHDPELQECIFSVNARKRSK